MPENLWKHWGMDFNGGKVLLCLALLVGLALVLVVLVLVVLVFLFLLLVVLLLSFWLLLLSLLLFLSLFSLFLVSFVFLLSFVFFAPLSLLGFLGLLGLLGLEPDGRLLPSFCCGLGVTSVRGSLAVCHLCARQAPRTRPNDAYAQGADMVAILPDARL